MTWETQGWAEAAVEYRANGRRPAPKLAAVAPRRFQLVPFSDLNPGTALTYLVKGLIPRVGIVAVWGPPKCGKSFWTFDLAMHSALGRDYRGRRVAPGTVVYCAFEGAEGFNARAAAFRDYHHLGDVAEVPFFLVPTRMNLVRDHAGLIASIREQVGSDSPVSVVLDTLNRSLAGSESSDEDMTAYLGAADAIREAFDCAVIIVHHCGVDGSRASRLLKKRCNDTSPLSDWKCRALCLPIWSTLVQSAGYSDQSGQLDEIVGRHRQGELEVEFPNAT